MDAAGEKCVVDLVSLLSLFIRWIQPPAIDHKHESRLVWFLVLWARFASSNLMTSCSYHKLIASLSSEFFHQCLEYLYIINKGGSSGVAGREKVCLLLLLNLFIYKHNEQMS